jgi:hypothetical protein
MVRSHKESCCQVPGTAGKVKVDALTTLLVCVLSSDAFR